MTIDYKRYPANWLTEIRPNILKRAGNCCEQCNVPDHAIIRRLAGCPEHWMMYIAESDEWVGCNGGIYTYTPQLFAESPKQTKVILTIHHIGIDKPDGTKGDPHDKMDCRDENLIALCQRCHLLADLPTHLANAARTRAEKKAKTLASSGQLPLDFGGVK